MSKTIKTNKTAAAATTTDAAALIRADFAAYAAARRERVAFLLSGLATMSEADAAAAQDEIRACKNRAERAERFAASMDNAAYAQAVIDYNVTMSNATALQLYAQDKLHDTLRALGASCRLSAVAGKGHANMMTQTLIAALDACGPLTISDAPRRMHDQNKGKSIGTYNAQASSSRQVLDLLGLLDWDMLSKTFKLNTRGESVREVIAH